MKILYICHRIPYPPDKGDKIRSFNEIKYLSTRHEIHVACLADDPKDLKYKEDLIKYCKTVTVFRNDPRLARIKSLSSLLSQKPLSLPYFYSTGLQKAVDHLLSTNNFDSIFCFSSPMAEYVFRSKWFVSNCSKLHIDRDQETRNKHPEAGNQNSATGNEQPATSNRQRATGLIMDFVDVDSDKWSQYARYSGFPKSWIYEMESKRLRKYERRVAEAFDHSIFVTEAEVKMFKEENPHIKSITAITNGVDLDFFSPQHRNLELDKSHNSVDRQSSASQIQPVATGSRYRETSIEKPVILFTGAMDYYANVDGVLWFVRDILPLIQKEIACAKFFIVGSNPAKEIRALHHRNGITVTGYVVDIRSYYEMADVGIIPLRLARGIQNKVLEAMAMALPVVATSPAFEGIHAETHKDLLVEDEPIAFSRAVLKILQTPSFQIALGSHARKCIEDHYSWRTNLSKLEVLIQGLMTNGRGGSDHPQNLSSYRPGPMNP